MRRVQILSTSRLTKDLEHGIGYLHVRLDRRISHTLPMDDINVDVDEHGMVVGVEFMNLKEIEDG